MRTCSNCGYKTLVWDSYIDRYTTCYRCTRCGEYTIITMTQEEIKQREKEELEDWMARDSRRRADREWYREHDDMCRR